MATKKKEKKRLRVKGEEMLYKMIQDKFPDMKHEYGTQDYFEFIKTIKIEDSAPMLIELNKTVKLKYLR